MNKKYEDVVRIPEYALSYLINADDSGIEAEDKINIDLWLTRLSNKWDCTPNDIIINPIEDDNGNWDKEFTWAPAFGLACDVVSCDVVILDRS